MFIGPILFLGMLLLPGMTTGAHAEEEGSSPRSLSGLQIWNVGHWDTIYVGDCYGVSFKRPTAVEIVGARNGTFTGHLVGTCSTGSIEGICSKASDLANKDGKARIAAEHVKILYGMKASRKTSWTHPYRFDGLQEEPPEEVEVVKPRRTKRWKPKSSAPIASLSLWIKINVPAEAAPGDYEGTVTFKDDNTPKTTVPVRLKVHDWRMPDLRDFTMRNLGFSSPESIAKFYDLEIWSEKHFAYMERSLELAFALGSRYVIADLAAGMRTRSNSQGLVRFIKQKDGSYKHDLGPFDRYMEIVAKVMGKPHPLRLNFWGQLKEKDGALYNGNAKHISVYDPETEEVTQVEQPLFGTKESYELWKPVLDDIRKRVEKRGWYDVTAAGDLRYAGLPKPQVIEVYRRIWKDGKVAATQHGKPSRFPGAKGDNAPVIVTETVWREGKLRHRGYGGQAKRTGVRISCTYARNRHEDSDPLWRFRVLPEEAIMRGHAGIGPLGMECFPYGHRGRYYVVGGNSALGPNCSTRSLLAPGPNGPVPTERYEAYREGVQLCEAVLFIHRALLANKIDGDLAKRANEVLNERSRHFLGSFPTVKKKQRLDLKKMTEGAEKRDIDLLAMAAEVDQALRAGNKKTVAGNLNQKK